MKVYKKHSYPDGDFYIEVLNPVPTDSFTFRINNFEDLWELNHVVDAFNHLGIKPTITIPQLISSQADRRFGNRQSSGLKLVCKFLNGLNANFRIFHPHNFELVEGLLDNVEIIDNSQFIREVLNELFLDFRQEKEVGNIEDHLILMSTDGGSYKWINKLADKIDWRGEVYGASKSRKYVEGKSKLTQQIDKQDFEGKDVLILDDISVMGGTFVGLAKMLKERNCGKLYLAVSHLTVESPNPELFNLFDAVFTTNSKGLDYKVEGSGHDKIGYTPENLKIINLF